MSNFTDTTSMPTKFSTLCLLFLLTVVYRASADTSGCKWQHTASHCGSAACTPDLPQQVTIGQGGCGNGHTCKSGFKVLCCPSNFVPKNCQWANKGLDCSGKCPPGKVQLSVSDTAGDTNICVPGCKAFCCDA